MEKIIVSVSWSGKNYCAYAQGSELNGLIAVTNKTLDGLKKEFPESLRLHIEGCVQDHDMLPEWVVTGAYELNYQLEAEKNNQRNFDMETFLRKLPVGIHL